MSEQGLQPVLEELGLWLDQMPRTGAENMAVDQLLMEHCGDLPILRVYQWSEPTVSFGYSNALADARKTFPCDESEELAYIRRWTGGGVVDHRIDVTYTLVIPRTEELALVRGAESYRIIHQALAEVLAAKGEKVRLTSCCEGDGGVECFTNPVAFDLTHMDGRKVAGAGQRRSRYGLLHQGSVIPSSINDQFRTDLLPRLGALLAEKCVEFYPEQKMLEGVAALAAERYAANSWLQKR
ncbi:hypothetical protein NT6N_17020 [Oceaniferula spumae]|uniref:BPL/LPL catalytic domain-containing protein n=1 Tax=Oceaniferula spumae TaxID=2979115 RepID=A0AAT9FL53_9BACT